MPLPIAPMLSRTGELPTGNGWSFEVKWDGFRALVSTEDGLQVREPAWLVHDGDASRAW